MSDNELKEGVARWLHEHEAEHAVGYDELDETEKDWYRMFAGELLELIKDWQDVPPSAFNPNEGGECPVCNTWFG
jgi:hypothetical protein